MKFADFERNVKLVLSYGSSDFMSAIGHWHSWNLYLNQDNYCYILEKKVVSTFAEYLYEFSYFY